MQCWQKLESITSMGIMWTWVQHAASTSVSVVSALSTQVTLTSSRACQGNSEGIVICNHCNLTRSCRMSPEIVIGLLCRMICTPFLYFLVIGIELRASISNFPHLSFFLSSDIMPKMSLLHKLLAWGSLPFTLASPACSSSSIGPWTWYAINWFTCQILRCLHLSL